MAIKKSAEDYLETMLILKEQKGYIRSIDIAEHLGVTKPSVSYATKHLRESGHITMERDGMITLTPTGMSVAAKIYERHRIFSDLLVYLGVNPDTAMKDACEIEHDVSDETFDRIRETWQRVCQK
ncbi:metal-dependent transcriptional regulator [Eubacterium sp. AB3007]|uniref:metal-dependent transcriptional regulator n=1 Tax=Eubacterium sp. AB3007 TaxID=1392487 RepID=UPI0004804A90|nr:metal-dependent transcriptional regulator [Eubacterium sp. AB3007]